MELQKMLSKIPCWVGINGDIILIQIEKSILNNTLVKLVKINKRKQKQQEKKMTTKVKNQVISDIVFKFTIKLTDYLKSKLNFFINFHFKSII